jgi:integrase
MDSPKLLGHSDSTVTLRIYTLVRDEEVEVASHLLRKALSTPNARVA